LQVITTTDRPSFHGHLKQLRKIALSEAQVLPQEKQFFKHVQTATTASCSVASP
jgi:hypothetical protein